MNLKAKFVGYVKLNQKALRASSLSKKKIWNILRTVENIKLKLSEHVEGDVKKCLGGCQPPLQCLFSCPPSKNILIKIFVKAILFKIVQRSNSCTYGYHIITQSL